MLLSELASLNIEQVESDIISVIGKGNKERKIYTTPAVKQTLIRWLAIRNSLDVNTRALFISRNKNRLATRSIQNVIKKHIIAARIKPVGLSTHKLMHTCATLMLKYGVRSKNAIMRLEHSNVGSP